MQTLAAKPSERKAERYRLLEYLRSVTVRRAGRKCMFALGSTMSAAATAAGQVHTAGVVRCASVWACPVCAPVIRERRAVEIDQGLSRHLESGGLAYFVTSTVKHSAGTPLDQTLDIVQKSWSSMMQSRSARRDCYAGQIRAIEVTHGSNGWHPHVHALMFFEPGTSRSTAEAYLANLSTGWRHQLQRRGATCHEVHGFDIRPVGSVEGAAGYLTKVAGGEWGAGLEVARGDLKLAKGTSTTPFEFLARAAAGEAFAQMMWGYYETATAGRRAIVWSRGLKARLGVEDISDDQAAEEKLDDAPVVRAIIPAGSWRHLLAIGQAADLLEVLGQLGKGAPVSVWRWPPLWLFEP